MRNPFSYSLYFLKDFLCFYIRKDFLPIQYLFPNAFTILCELFFFYFLAHLHLLLLYNHLQNIKLCQKNPEDFRKNRKIFAFSSWSFFKTILFKRAMRLYYFDTCIWLDLFEDREKFSSYKWFTSKNSRRFRHDPLFRYYFWRIKSAGIWLQGDCNALVSFEKNLPI